MQITNTNRITGCPLRFVRFFYIFVTHSSARSALLDFNYYRVRNSCVVSRAQRAELKPVDVADPLAASRRAGSLLQRVGPPSRDRACARAVAAAAVGII